MVFVKSPRHSLRTMVEPDPCFMKLNNKNRVKSDKKGYINTWLETYSSLKKRIINNRIKI